jgi:hypothetical protein
MGRAVLPFMVWLVLGPVVASAEDYLGGFIPENPKAYNAFPLRPSYRNFLPASKDLSDDFPPVGRQGPQSSCVGWALGYAARSYYSRRGWRSDAGPPEPFSPSFIYNQTKEGNCASGSSISSGLKLLESVGVVGISEFPYEPEACSRQPTPAQLDRAQKNRIKSWARVETSHPDAIKAEIHQGNPVVIGLWVTPSFYQMKKGTYSDVSDGTSGGHALVVVGYDDERHAFKVVNSWGEKWGERGFGWISYEAMMKRIQNAFVMVPDQETSGTQPAEFIPWAETKASPEKGQMLSQTLIDRWERGLPCTSIRPFVSDHRSSSWKGIVGDLTTQQHLSEWMVNTLGPDADKIEIEVRPWPQCEAIQTLKPVLAEQNGFSVLINGQPEISLQEGDSVFLTIQRPEHKKYLSVFYLQADGSVVSLTVPGFSAKDSSHDPIALGDAPRSLTVTKPLGEEMVIVVASERPLPDELTSDLKQGDRAFLTHLRQAILANKSSRVSQNHIVASYAILHTH